jgi:hypothetical protein
VDSHDRDARSTPRPATSVGRVELGGTYDRPVTNPLSRLQKFSLGVIGALSLAVGMWAQFAPRSFYEDFPGWGQHWVSIDGPFNEHLVRDVGGLNLAIAVLAGAALITKSSLMARVTGLAALVYGLPHAVYHSSHLGTFESTFDKIVSVSGLWFTCVLALQLALGPAGQLRSRSRQPA